MFSENYIGNICISGIGNSVAGDTVVTRDRTREDLRRTTQEKILGLLRENPELTRKVLATRIGITPDSAKHHLDSLKKTGRIRHVGPTKKGRWEIMKYSE